MHVEDRIDRSRSWWPKGSQGNVAGDYAIVSRILESKTEISLVIIAGLNHEDPPAGEFATNPQMIADLERIRAGLEKEKSTGRAPHRCGKWCSKFTDSGCRPITGSL